MELEIDSTRSTFEQETLPHKSVLYRTAFSVLRKRSESEEAVQETYFQAWKSFHTFETGTNCRAWMFSILFNVIRRQRREWTFRVLLTNDVNVFERTSPGASISSDLTDRQILSALGKLPRSYAVAVILADIDELSYKEISEATGRPIGTVMSSISRGRELLRQALAPLAEERGIMRGARQPA
jgi:RNA polymerase sigma-70 factor, ECF subfamily